MSRVQVGSRPATYLGIAPTAAAHTSADMDWNICSCRSHTCPTRNLKGPHQDWLGRERYCRSQLSRLPRQQWVSCRWYCPQNNILKNYGNYWTSVSEKHIRICDSHKGGFTDWPSGTLAKRWKHQFFPIFIKEESSLLRHILAKVKTKQLVSGSTAGASAVDRKEQRHAASLVSATQEVWTKAETKSNLSAASNESKNWADYYSRIIELSRSLVGQYGTGDWPMICRAV